MTDTDVVKGWGIDPKTPRRLPLSSTQIHLEPR